MASDGVRVALFDTDRDVFPKKVLEGGKPLIPARDNGIVSVC